ncbi:hypothetical protein Scep_019353 [Stephania cephalantha]|uniref:Uncharacterized protein n=1 Tax=Stephania cephalantha TaxID=152367 RepID=A0AAP0NMU1_9MAGN
MEVDSVEMTRNYWKATPLLTGDPSLFETSLLSASITTVEALPGFSGVVCRAGNPLSWTCSGQCLRTAQKLIDEQIRFLAICVSQESLGISQKLSSLQQTSFVADWCPVSKDWL